MRRFIFFISAFCIAFGISITAYTQDKIMEVDKIFSWITPATPGCVCAISQNGKPILTRAYGMADIEREVLLTPNSVFDAGSVRKQFVAAAVLMLSEKGQLSLSDEVQKYIPELPDYGHRITIDNLLTHTSGIRDWQPLLNLAGGDPDAMTMILRQRGLNFIPGEEWSYSNSGYVLLTEIVNRISKMSFPEFAQKHFFEPLDMTSTIYVNDMMQLIKSRALGYSRSQDSWKLDMYLGNDRGGAGALFTTANDLVRWNNALAESTLGSLVSEKLQEPAKLSNGRKISYARGLSLEPFRGVNMVSHSGGVAGYHSWAGFLPDQQLSVAVMCNSDSRDATSLAYRIIDLYVSFPPNANSESGPPPEINADALMDVNRKTGLFFNEATGRQIRLVVDRGRFRIAGGPGLLMISKEKFRRWGAVVEFMSQDKFELNFLSEDSFELKTMEGKISRYTRAKPYTPSAGELQHFTGRYESDELMAFLDFSAGNGILLGRANENPGKPFEFRAVNPDTFQFAGVILRFVRDSNGKITGLDFSNPLLRNIRFTRVA